MSPKSEAVVEAQCSQAGGGKVCVNCSETRDKRLADVFSTPPRYLVSWDDSTTPEKCNSPWVQGVPWGETWETAWFVGPISLCVPAFQHNYEKSYTLPGPKPWIPPGQKSPVVERQHKTTSCVVWTAQQSDNSDVSWTWTGPVDLSSARSWAWHNFLGTTLITLWLSVTCPVKSGTNQHSELQDKAVMLKYCYVNYVRQHLTSTPQLHNHQTTLPAFVARLDLVQMQAKTSFSSWWGGSFLTSFPGQPFRKPFRRTHSLWWRHQTSL